MENKPVTLFGLPVANRKVLLNLVKIVVILWIISWIFLTVKYSGDPKEAGTFGDMFGAVNSLFSGLAAAGLFYTILLQMEQLREQRVDAEHQKEESKIQRLQIDRQERRANRQQFESTFFNLINSHHKIISGISLSLGQFGPVVSGMEFLDSFIKTLRTEFGQVPMNRDDEQELIAAFNEMAKNYHRPFKQYFQGLTSIFKFISDTDLLEDKDRQFYFNLLIEHIPPLERSALIYFLTFADTALFYSIHELLLIENKYKTFQHMVVTLYGDDHDRLKTWWKHYTPEMRNQNLNRTELE